MKLQSRQQVPPVDHDRARSDTERQQQQQQQQQQQHKSTYKSFLYANKLCKSAAKDDLRGERRKALVRMFLTHTFEAIIVQKIPEGLKPTALEFLYERTKVLHTAIAYITCLYASPQTKQRASQN
ncbi:hypothetical protein F2P81_012859 [Scophthalmus maximus]|uniref:Uncharacterized protein n=1 Tax=Scophthalmus maximus TaxID=52904 RepID=A0A6A4SVL0_SCOMX|nr:hypothetical protein F2P81_012859 [Scophthalmus maximus]